MILTSKEIQNAIRNHINVQEFVCGWGASFINISVTYPVYKIMFRQVNKFLMFEIHYGATQKLSMRECSIFSSRCYMALR